MSFDADEEILQDFLVEAGEILELLSEQLVELEGSPDDMNLLNAIFRGFHTVKGGAGFLQLNELVACCHIAENVFDILRKGERRVTSDLMDVVLQALDSVNAMFQEVREGKPLTPATDELLEALASLAEPGTANEQTNNSSSAMSAETADQVDAEFEQLLEAIPASHIAPSVESSSMDDLITDDEFEALLDQLHGPVTSVASAVEVATAKSNETVANAASNEITDDEFEALLDQLHGEGKFSVEDASSSIKAEDNAMTSTTTTSSAADPALISDDEFESLLDQLHGKGKFKVTVKNSEESPVTPVNDTPVKKESVSAKPAAIVKTPAVTAKPATSQATEVETTVRVDTARLDDIMNMVGELVLVRNRLVRLGLSSGDETMAKVVGHLDVVTGDLQSAVMKTRMQPIKKVFGRFPRLVRDMARNLKKEIRLELVGEETDLDKNLVEALADPLVHLVRNSVDHGIESPAEREAAGKSREGCVILSAAQEGDHIQLTISDDGKGMDANVLRNKAIEKGMLEKEAGLVVASGGPYTAADADKRMTSWVSIPGTTPQCHTVVMKDSGNNGWNSGNSELGHGMIIYSNNQQVFLQAVANFGASTSFNKAFRTNGVLENEKFVDASFAMFPNPTTGIVNFTTQETLNVTVVDMTGKTVHTAKDIKDGDSINLSTLQSGIYIAKIKGEKSQRVEKIIIK